MPRGLQKRVDSGRGLPPGWEQRVEAGKRIPEDVEKRATAIPDDIKRRMPKPPRGTEDILIEDHIFRVKEATREVVDRMKLR